MNVQNEQTASYAGSGSTIIVDGLNGISRKGKAIALAFFSVVAINLKFVHNSVSKINIFLLITKYCRQFS